MRFAFLFLFAAPAVFGELIVFSDDWWTYCKTTGTNYCRRKSTFSTGPIVGKLLRKDAASDKHFCEAVLVAYDRALTSHECVPVTTEANSYKSGDVIYRYKTDKITLNVKVSKFIKSEGSTLAYAVFDVDAKTPVPGPYAAIITSGPGSADLNKVVAYEACPRYPVTVSSVLLGLVPVDKLSFINDTDSKLGNLLLGSTETITWLKPGASVLRELPNGGVGVLSIFSEKYSTEAKKEVVPVPTGTRRKRDFNSNNIRRLLRLDDSSQPPRNAEQRQGQQQNQQQNRNRPLSFVGNNPLIVGTFNLNGVGRQRRAMGADVQTTIRNVAQSSTMMFFQGSRGIQENALNLPNREVHISGDFSISFDNTRYGRRRCDNLGLNNEEYGLRCILERNDADIRGQLAANQQLPCASVYNVRLSSTDSDLRRRQLVDATARAAVDRECENMLFLGDFSEDYLHNGFHHARRADALLPNLVFENHNPGPTVRLPRRRVGPVENVNSQRGQSSSYIFPSPNMGRTRSYYLSPEASIQPHIASNEQLELLNRRLYVTAHHPVLENEPEYRASDIADHLMVSATYRGGNTGDIRVASLNVGGAQNNAFEFRSELMGATFERLLNFEDRQNSYPRADIIAVQDVPKKIKDTVTTETSYGYHWKTDTVAIKTRDGKSTGETERLGFAYASEIKVINCSVFDPDPPTGRDRERGVFACTFQRGPREPFTLVNVHVAPGLTTVKARSSLQTQLRKTYIQKPVITMGDYNIDYRPSPIGDGTDLTNSKRGKCQFYLPATLAAQKRQAVANWEYTEVKEKRIVDYIFEPDEQYPGPIDKLTSCKILNPNFVIKELSIKDRAPPVRARAFGDWSQVSDHYPVLMRISD